MTSGTGSTSHRVEAAAFGPPEQGWARVSPRLATARRIVAVGAVAVLGLAVCVVLALVAPAWTAVLALLVTLAVASWAWWLVGRQVAAMGYAERADDLLVTRGIMFRELVVVPYGRMQLVDVHAGPLDRRYGIARLQLHTAAATTDATIDGLPDAEARRLRDRLAALGEARSAGL